MLCWLLYVAYPIFSLDLCPRFPTWLGKNEGIKKWMALKNRRRSCSRFAINLGNQEWMRSSEREGKGALKTANLGKRDRNHSCQCPGPTRLHTLRSHTLRPHSARMTKHGLILSHAVLFYQPHMMWPHMTRPHSSAWNSQLNGIPPVRAPCESFRQGLGENWGKTKELGKTEYN
jgi:hypothetical protein